MKPDARRVIGGFAALGSATLAGQVLGFVLLAVAARRLGPSDLGAFSFGINLVTYFAIPANFGVTALAIRDVAEGPERVKEIAGEVLVLQAGLSVLPYLLLVAMAGVLAPSELAASVLPIVGLTFVVDALSFWWVLVGTQRYTVLALARLAGGVVQTALVLLFVERGSTGVLVLSWATLAGFVITSALALFAVLKERGPPSFRQVSARGVLRRFVASAPLGVAAVMISIYYSVDSVMLGYLKDTATVGQYAVAYKLPLAFLAFAALWTSVLLPHARNLWLQDKAELRRQAGMFSSIALVAAVPLGVGALFSGQALMPALFGEEFDPAGTPFVLLTFAAALVAFTATYGTLAIAIGDERHYAIAVTLGAVSNLLLNLVVIPPFGMTGAALATIAAEVLVFAYVYARLLALLGPMPLQRRRIARVALATVPMAAVLALLGDRVGVVAEIAIGSAVYAIAAAALGVVHVDELRAVLRRPPAAVPPVAGS